MSEYQAVYDAVRSRFHGDFLTAFETAVRDCFSVEWWRVQHEFANAAVMAQAPHVLLRPSLSIDGNMWCALYGENLQDGVAGFGKSPAEAMNDFDSNYHKNLAEGRS